ncbi:hypothetical protein M7I_0432 [Glarea lozoyensis 74030]|uniref:Uncharacterized protein n=1 Tax=Glarea lozoyensis (strain ATCC 74030 / MF5533) TaxID=1104152 RepID=H0EDC4_GLAL7|nr:hypothetical protein M7I_0432 [Glarea lozoyensis 74030]
MQGSVSSTVKQDRFAILTAIEEASEEGSGAEDQGEQPRPQQLGPSMKSLAYTLSQILDELPFGEGPAYEIAINDNFQTSLTEAFARSEALKELYKSKEMDRDRPASVEADFEEVAASFNRAKIIKIQSKRIL